MKLKIYFYEPNKVWVVTTTEADGNELYLYPDGMAKIGYAEDEETEIWCDKTTQEVTID